MRDDEKIRDHKFVIGTSGWAYRDWVGPFYPNKTPASSFLAEYSRRFSAVEIDSTFYAIPQIKNVAKWAENVPGSFSFSPKFPKIITHDKQLIECDSELALFLQVMEILGDKLGPLVLQFDYTFRIEQLRRLADFLGRIPSGFRIAVEVRHRGWHTPEFFEMLRENNTALVLHDLYYMPKKTEITADFTYIRLLGNRKQVPDDFSHVRIERNSDFEWWAQQVKEFMSREIDVFLFINNRYQGHAPASVRAFLEILHA